MAEKWLVLKFGGSSVAGKPQWQNIAELAQARQADGYRVLLVCSALAGVTNHLTTLSGQPQSKDLLTELLDTHRRLSESLGVDSDEWLPAAETLLEKSLARCVKHPGPSSSAELLAMGEWMSTRIGVCFLQRNLDVDWVDAREALEIQAEADLSLARRWLSASCKPGPDRALQARWGKLKPVLLTQGFIARTPNGETALLGRGGSDTSAALLAGRLCAERLEIWTDVPGLFSADPRLISQARLLREVDYSEALEMAASGARVVHSQCIRAAAATDTPVVIRDVNRRDIKGTSIGSGINGKVGVKTITCQKNMAVILLQNLDARRQVGFLARVFNIFRLRGISVDLVATSETTTTVALNCTANHLLEQDIDALVADLEACCRVKVFQNCVCVNLVGRGARTALSRMESSMRLFDTCDLLMLSQSANDLCLSILVHDHDHEALLRSAHQALIPGVDQEPCGSFGDSWELITAKVRP